jgi:hypothetical protein
MTIDFQIIDSNNSIAMRTNHISCIPPDSHLASMETIGYKFKLDGKFVSRRKINTLRKQKSNVGNVD